jgi:hypothetical protein
MSVPFSAARFGTTLALSPVRCRAAFLRRGFTILNLAGQDINHEFGELVCVTGALLAPALSAIRTMTSL